jgi:hypothetical protein
LRTPRNDERGIDVALLFDTELFQAGETFNHAILKRNAGRAAARETGFRLTRL